MFDWCIVCWWSWLVNGYLFVNGVMWKDDWFFVVINLVDDFGDDSLLIMTCWFCGCKYLIMQWWWIGEYIIWWWKLYNIDWWYVHCRVFVWSPCIHDHVKSYEECKWRCTFTLFWWNNILEVHFTLGVNSYSKIISGIQLVPHACRSV